MPSFDALGHIFDIERFATEDGPGIRTVVFFQGCNKQCPRCHNPEGIGISPRWILEKGWCLLCGTCAAVCPQGVHSVGSEHHFNSNACIGCMECVKCCLPGALKSVWKTISVDEAVRQILLDHEYYKNSGGGVTLSGGELMMQQAFATEILQRMKNEGIATAIETNLSFPWEAYEKLMPYVDLVMADIKIWNDEQHKRLTGISNSQILINVDHLTEQNKPMIVRTPIIPGVNDTRDAVKPIASFLKGRKNLLYYELLSYHPLGVEKAQKMGMCARRYEIPSKEKMEMLGTAILSDLRKIRINGRDFALPPYTL